MLRRFFKLNERDGLSHLKIPTIASAHRSPCVIRKKRIDESSEVLLELSIHYFIFNLVRVNRIVV